MGRNFLLLIALLATLVGMGSWDNRRQMERVLGEGYPTTAQITGAQSMPVAAFNGWRPRLIEQSLAVDLEWKSKDGKSHIFRNVPVSAGLERSIVNGSQVRLLPVPAKVLDDGSAVPVITSDASARLASLQSWLAASGYAALAAWAGFAALSLLGGRGRRVVTAIPPKPLPPRRTFIGLAVLVVGGFLAFSAWSSGRTVDAVALGGEQITADILQATETKGGHAIRIGWSDGTGVHHYGPIPIGEAFWNKITQNGQLTVHQTAIRYRGDDPAARPLIVDDASEAHWSVRVAMGAGLLLILFGTALFVSGLRARRN
ncbi:MAG TPA: hypothetical protein VGJ56_20330 [Reyranella sp.]